MPKWKTQQSFFSSSTREAFQSPARKGWDLMPTQNFRSVLDPAKYGRRHVPSKAPGWNRECCEYTTSFQVHRTEEQVAANSFARERVKFSQEARDVRGIGKLASAADTTFRSSYPHHPVPPKLPQPQNPHQNKHVGGFRKLPERSASEPHIAGLVGSPDDWSPRTLRQIAICRTPGVRPSTETRRRYGPMDTTTNHMVEFAAEQYKKHVPDKITRAKAKQC